MQVKNKRKEEKEASTNYKRIAFRCALIDVWLNDYTVRLPHTHTHTHKHPSSRECSAIVIRLQWPAYFTQVLDFIWNVFCGFYKCYISIIWISSPLALLQRKIDIWYRKLFWIKFNAKQLLFEGFLAVMRIFGSIGP